MKMIRAILKDWPSQILNLVTGASRYKAHGISHFHILFSKISIRERVPFRYLFDFKAKVKTPIVV